MVAVSASDTTAKSEMHSWLQVTATTVGSATGAGLCPSSKLSGFLSCLLTSGSLVPPVPQVYRLYSESISQAIVTGGPHTARSSFVKYMRSVKKAVLRLVEVFVEKCEDDALLVTKFVPALMEPVLADYASSVPDAR